MPHINVKCYKGRTPEQLKEIAQKIADAATEAFGAKQGSVSVTIEEVDKEDWKAVYDNEIYGGNGSLLVEPQYKM